MAKSKNVSVLKVMSFRDLMKYKKRINIKDENNSTIFTMEEPSNDQLVEFIQNIVFAKKEDQAEDNTFNFKGKDITSIFRKCVKGIEIEDLTEEEVEEILSSLPYSIKSQIESALEILVTAPLQNYIKKLNERFEALMADAKKEEDAINGEKQETIKE